MPQPLPAGRPLTGTANDSSRVAVILLRGLGKLVELFGALHKSIDADGGLQGLGANERL